jgi:polyhydroxyalkanoate synthesis regulator protein
MRNDRPSRQPVLVKRYADRRLYNTESSTYMSFDDLAAMLRKDTRFVVREAGTGEDITAIILDRLRSTLH